MQKESRVKQVIKLNQFNNDNNNNNDKVNVTFALTMQ